MTNLNNQSTMPIKIINDQYVKLTHSQYEELLQCLIDDYNELYTNRADILFGPGSLYNIGEYYADPNFPEAVFKVNKQTFINTVFPTLILNYFTAIKWQL